MAALTEQHYRTEPSPVFVRILAPLVVAVFVILVFVFARFLDSSSQAQSVIKQSTQQSVVGKDCLQCHRTIVQSFALDAHGKSAKFLNDSRAAKCELCHANSDKHAETSTKTKSAGEVVNPAKTTAALANESCLQCHSMDRSHFNWKGGKHDRNDMSCLSCHSVHHGSFLTRMSANLADKSEQEVAEILAGRLPEKELTSFTVEDTCLACHKDVRKALFQRSTHLFRTEHWVPTDGRQVMGGQPTGMKVTCTTCHDPHGGEGAKMLAARSTNDLCYTCHAEKRGPLLWEHPPVQENCLTCHTQHGSNNPMLLTRRTHQLCQQCHVHLLPRHETVAGFDVVTFNRACMNCHSQIHGSNHPSGRAFTR